MNTQITAETTNTPTDAEKMAKAQAKRDRKVTAQAETKQTEAEKQIAKEKATQEARGKHLAEQDAAFASMGPQIKAAIEAKSAPAFQGNVADESIVVTSLWSSGVGQGRAMEAYSIEALEEMGIALTSKDVAKAALSSTDAERFRTVTGRTTTRLIALRNRILTNEERAQKDAERVARESKRQPQQKRWQPIGPGQGLSSLMSPEAKEAKRAKKAQKEATRRAESARLSVANAEADKRARAKAKAEAEAKATAKANKKNGKR